MRIADVYRPGHFGLSVEIFPPKTTEGDVALFENLSRLVRYRPSFVSCTYGAGGSTRDRTIELCVEIQKRFATAATAHFTCVGATVDDMREWLQRAQTAGIPNIMALRGDPPAEQKEFRAVEGGFKNANELVSLIRSEFPEFGIGVAGYPEKHGEAIDAAADLKFLKQKVDAGGNAVYTQLFYQNSHFLQFRDRCEQSGIRVPIIPGIMPITEFARIKRITSMCQVEFPVELSAKLEAVQDDKQAQFEIGVEYAIAQCRDLIDQGVPGIHFYVLNKSQACEMILDALNFAPVS